MPSGISSMPSINIELKEIIEVFDRYIQSYFQNGAQINKEL